MEGHERRGEGALRGAAQAGPGGVPREAVGVAGHPGVQGDRGGRQEAGGAAGGGRPGGLHARQGRQAGAAAGQEPRREGVQEGCGAWRSGFGQAHEEGRPGQGGGGRHRRGRPRGCRQGRPRGHAAEPGVAAGGRGGRQDVARDLHGFAGCEWPREPSAAGAARCMSTRLPGPSASLTVRGMEGLAGLISGWEVFGAGLRSDRSAEA
mmetsp:Transcript_51279/g.153309  ORF Transcript_51279/g.153309 Transcript_51279/m.153309 type:complete len:207 (+) Transcript_51279:483-1103(+)